jgi:hypothetical protein
VLFLSRTAVAITMVLPLAAGVTEAGSDFSNASPGSSAAILITLRPEAKSELLRCAQLVPVRVLITISK